MITNVNARKTSDGGIFVQYQTDGKSKDAVFLNWSSFISWFYANIGDNE